MVYIPSWPRSIDSRKVDVAGYQTFFACLMRLENFNSVSDAGFYDTNNVHEVPLS